MLIKDKRISILVNADYRTLIFEKDISSQWGTLFIVSFNLKNCTLDIVFNLICLLLITIMDTVKYESAHLRILSYGEPTSTLTNNVSFKEWLTIFDFP